MSSKRIVLATSPAPEMAPLSTDEKRFPLGIGFLISILEKAGHQVWFFDDYLRPTGFEKSDFLSRNRIQFVGLYISTVSYSPALGVLNRLQELRRSGKWNGKIMVGGPHVSLRPDTIPEFVDHLVIGEGETAVLDIVDNGARSRVVTHEPIRDLDSLPMPAYERFQDDAYNLTVNKVAEHPVYTMNTSRGCPYLCTFCSVGGVWGRNYRAMSAERIIEDIARLKSRWKVKGIYFREDHFTLDKARTADFCQRLIRSSMDMIWLAESRVDSLDSELLELMKRAGCRWLYLGCESGSPRMLERYNKGITVEQIESVLHACRRLDIKTYASFIVGTPGETEADRKATEELVRRTRPDIFGYNVFVGLPGSPLYDDMIRSGEYDHLGADGIAYIKGHDDFVRTYYGDSYHQFLIPRD
ncbi:B12-binding domain-containing radical SAM protein [candidate division KSB1 bacterium]